jgi:hypothetical protein
LFDCLAFKGCGRYVKTNGLPVKEVQASEKLYMFKGCNKKIVNFPDPINYLTESFVPIWNILSSFL